MIPQRYVAVDLETTGLNPKRDKIIEIGAVRMEKGEQIEQFQMFVNPHRAISSFITELTGIEDRMLENAPGEEEAVRAFLAFLGDDVLLGHHLIFDYSFLKHSAVNLGILLEKSGMDTLKIARRFLPDLESRSLEALCTYFQIQNQRAHRAKEDAAATSQIYERLKECFAKGELEEKVFEPEPLICQVKKESPITPAQIRYLKALLERHGLSFDKEIEFLTKSEASREIDAILLKHGKIAHSR